MAQSKAWGTGNAQLQPCIEAWSLSVSSQSNRAALSGSLATSAALGNADGNRALEGEGEAQVESAE